MQKTLAIILALFVAACGTAELSGADRAAVRGGQKGLIRTSNMPLLGSMVFDTPETAQILSIDGRKVDSEILKLDEQIAVEVGPHVLELACVDRSGHNEKDFTELLDLNVKAHHEYVISCSFDWRFGPNGTYLGAFHVDETPLR